MKLTQIRNATLLLEYAGKKFLIDPMLADKEAWPGFAGNARPHLRNPMAELPLPIEALLAVDAVIVTHTHMDPWDEAVQQLIPKTMMIYSQNEGDAALIRSQGFAHVRVLQDENPFVDGLTIYKRRVSTAAMHCMPTKSWAIFWAIPVVWCLSICQKKRSTLPGIPSGLSLMSERCNVFSRR